MGFGRKTWTTMFLLPVLGLAMGVQAGSVGYQFRIAGNNKNYPMIRLTNQSSSAKITSFTMTIGNVAYNFDSYRTHKSMSVGASTDIPDLFDDSVRTDELACSYTDFQPGAFHRFKIDVDPDSLNKRVDYRKILFNLGGNSDADNAQLTVTFSSGQSLSGHLPDFAGPNLGHKYAYSQSLELPNGGGSCPPPHTVPLPAGIWAGLGALGIMGSWRGAKRVIRTV